jgi:Tfp pilus assembly protein PilO
LNLQQVFNRISMGRAILLGLSLAAIYYFLVFDSGSALQKNIDASNQSLQGVQKQIQDLQSKLDRAAIYQKAAAEIGTTIGRLLSMIPEQFTVSDLTKIVSNEARVAGSSLNSINQGKADISSVGKEFEEFSVTIDMTGTFLQHMIFLSNLTKITQILVVRKLTMDIKDKIEDTPNIHMNAEIVAYRYRSELDKQSLRPGAPGAPNSPPGAPAAPGTPAAGGGK